MQLDIQQSMQILTQVVDAGIRKGLFSGIDQAAQAMSALDVLNRFVLANAEKLQPNGLSSKI